MARSHADLTRGSREDAPPTHEAVEELEEEQLEDTTTIDQGENVPPGNRRIERRESVLAGETPAGALLRKIRDAPSDELDEVVQSFTPRDIQKAVRMITASYLEVRKDLEDYDKKAEI